MSINKNHKYKFLLSIILSLISIIPYVRAELLYSSGIYYSISDYIMILIPFILIMIIIIVSRYILRGIVDAILNK
jgi:hypothetical protein